MRREREEWRTEAEVCGTGAGFHGRTWAAGRLGGLTDVIHEPLASQQYVGKLSST